MIDEPPRRFQLPVSVRLADAVFAALLDATLASRLEPGSRLRVDALAKELGVSRTPVREAIQRLVAEGIAREEPHKGAVLVSVGPMELASIYEVREVMEGLAARLAASVGTPTEIDAIERSFVEHRSALAQGDVERHFRMDMRFHRLIRVAAHNELLMLQLDQIQTKVRLAMITTSVSQGPESALRDHERILTALQQRNPAHAEEAARAHIRRLRMSLAEVAEVRDGVLSVE